MVQDRTGPAQGIGWHSHRQSTLGPGTKNHYPGIIPGWLFRAPSQALPSSGRYCDETQSAGVAEGCRFDKSRNCLASLLIRMKSWLSSSRPPKKTSLKTSRSARARSGASKLTPCLANTAATPFSQVSQPLRSGPGTPHPEERRTTRLAFFLKSANPGPPARQAIRFFHQEPKSVHSSHPDRSPGCQSDCLAN